MVHLLEGFPYLCSLEVNGKQWWTNSTSTEECLLLQPLVAMEPSPGYPGLYRCPLGLSGKDSGATLSLLSVLNMGGMSGAMAAVLPPRKVHKDHGGQTLTDRTKLLM